MFDGLRGKTVLITGATGGIGSAMVQAFASAGARVGIHYQRDRQKAEALRRHVEQQGGEAAVFRGWLLTAADARRLLQAFVRRFSGVDVLVNNAGAVLGAQPVLRLTESAWERTMALNAKAPFFLAQSAMRAMRRQGGGKIINISSIGVKYGGSDRSLHYAAAKAALEAVTIGLAKHGAPDGVLVNTIRAGFIDTPFHHRMGRRDVSARIRLIPLRRAGRPDDIAQAALYLASRAGDFITGTTLTVSGGD